jgi:hypothetical protein
MNTTLSQHAQVRVRQRGLRESDIGCRVVLAGQTVVTVYRPSRKTEKRLLRGEPRRTCRPDLCPPTTYHPGDQGHAA